MILLALLPVSAYFLLWLYLVAKQPLKNSTGADLRRALIQSSLLWSGYLVIGSEILSLFRGISALGVVLMWCLAIGVLAGMQWKAKALLVGWKRVRKALVNVRFAWFDWIVFTVICLVLLVLLITGLLSPPNIHDVLAYHMARVMHWIQNRSFVYYPTPYTLQLWMPPFSEMSQLHWYLLGGGDLLTSLPQWTSLILAMVAASLSAERLGAGRKGQWLAALFVLSIPIVILQASGAKNDLVLAALFSCLVYFILLGNFSRLSVMDWFTCAICVSLGVLTKGTFVFFALPLLLWLLVVMLKRAGWKSTLIFAGLGLAVLLVLNAGHWVRNTMAFGGPLSTGEENFLINAWFGVDVFISNLSRNIAVQMNGKYGFINEAVQKILDRIHAWIDLPLFDPGLTQGPAEFYYVPNREEVAGNPFHFVMTGLVFVMILVGLFKKTSQKSALASFCLALAAFCGVIIFSVVFRWQSWGTRLFLPFYVMFAPVFGLVFGKHLSGISAWAAGILLVVVLINPLLNNYSRAFSWSTENRNSIWRMSRKGLLFANNQSIEGAVLELTQLMAESGCRSYGVLMRHNAPEYLLWATLSPSPDAYHLEHIDVDNPTQALSNPDYTPCGIVMFEVDPKEFTIDPDYELVSQWQIGETMPFSLYLTPMYALEGME